MREPYRRYTTWRTRAIEPCRIDSSTPTRSKSCRSRGSGGVMYAYPNYWIVRLTKRTVARRIAPAIPVTCLRHRRRQGATTPREVNPRVQGQISWKSCGKRFCSISLLAVNWRRNQTTMGHVQGGAMVFTQNKNHCPQRTQMMTSS